MLIEYELLRNRRGPVVGTARMENGSIRLAIQVDKDREILERFFGDGAALARNEKLADGSVYWAKAGSRTWFQETVEQKLYYSAGYGYTVLTQAAAAGFLILRVEASSRSRRLSRDHFDEWAIRFDSSSPAVNGRALRALLSVWEQGFVDDGIIEREQDARLVHSLLDRPDDWEVVFAGPPQVQVPPIAMRHLGFEVAVWGGDFFSALDGVSGLNDHGLLDDQANAEKFRQDFITNVEPDLDLSVLEVWTTAG